MTIMLTTRINGSMNMKNTSVSESTENTANTMLQVDTARSCTDEGQNEEEMRKDLAKRQEAMRRRAELDRMRRADRTQLIEKPYTVREVCELTGWSVQTIIRIFTQERGTLIYEVDRPRQRASYRNIRIPRHVFRRVMQKMTLT